MVATGFTDAYTFLRHGRVFAEAMTGNLVLIGVGAAEPRIVAFWRPLLAFWRPLLAFWRPLLAFGAFLAGVVAAWLLAGRTPPARAAAAWPHAVAIIVQVAVLAVVGALPSSFSQAAIVAGLAFAAGLQITSFRRVGAAEVSTVVMTTNAAFAIGAAFAAFDSRDPLDIARARSLATTLLGFLGGALLGAFVSSALHDRAAWVDALLFAVAGALYLSGLSRRPDEPTGGQRSTEGTT